MKISVIIPVLREEAVINRTIDRIRAMDRAVEIVVVDGDPQGKTLGAVTRDHALLVASEAGRGRQMNEGAREAGGDVLVFLHADTELPANAFPTISSAMMDGRFVGGAFDLAIDGQGVLFRLIEKVASLRSRLTRIPYGDQAVFLQRDYFMRIGGYRDIPLMEDVDLMRRIKAAGGRICMIRKKVRTSARRWEREGILRCTLRNWTIVILYLLGVPPKRLVKWYPS
ncbi:MAG TPA: TIGR04283 family arsenosugar biosynthesis glycosyltransferase [Syntrophorhabdales bacterium]|nr:TIGR04283 family arsenosugar biosynthesis glycosyltransferase [Syntrophorhabdales bacterium]